MKKKIFAISGSTQKGSSNNHILRHIANTFKDIIELDLFAEIDQLPHFNPELDTDHPPVAITAFRKRIQEADGVIICSPEYIFSLPGSLKNAIEWNVSTTLFSGKAVAIIIAAASGEKAFASLDLIMTTIEAVISPTSKLLIKGAKAKVGEDGVFRDHVYAEKIEQLIASLLSTIENQDKTPTKFRN